MVACKNCITNIKSYIADFDWRDSNLKDTLNKYCGQPDVLYIHARIGGGNWPDYHAEVDTQPWFIEKVDDAFDSTYCDIYTKIK